MLVSATPTVRVSFQYNGELVAYEVEPIAYDENGFDITAPIPGVNYKAAGFTDREKTSKELTALAKGSKERPFMEVTGGKGLTAHSHIDAQSLFIRSQTGTQITVDSVQMHDILISGAEAAKRIKARLGYVPDGFLERMKAEYENNVPSQVIDELAAEYAHGSQFAQLG